MFLSKDWFLNLSATFIRFPLTYVCIVLLTALSININHEFYLIGKDLTTQLFCLFVVGIIWFTNAKLYIENLYHYRRQYLLVAIGIFFLIAYYIFSTSNIRFVFTFLPGLILLFTVTPFLFKKNSDTDFWDFNLHVVINIFFVLILVFALVLGLIIIAVTIRTLFYPGLDIFKVFFDIFILGCTIGVAYFLSTIPGLVEHEKINLGIGKLLSYIFIPIILVWFGILYVYIFRIMIQLKMPNGELGYLITCFGMIGITIHLLSYPFRRDSKISRLFYEYFYVAFIPVILLLIVAIGFRIQQYGLTENRYIMVLLTVWFIFLSAGRIFIKPYFNIKLIPFILSILLILSSFGPFGLTRLPISNQIALLKTILVKNSILINGKITSNHAKISPEVKARIASIVIYLAQKKEGLNDIKSWFNKEQFKEIDKEKTYNRHKVILNFMGIKRTATHASNW